MCETETATGPNLLIRLKSHALARMKERGIAGEHVERVLASPDEMLEVRFGGRSTFGNIDGWQLLLVYETKNDDVEVVTAFWIDTEGLKRYGFLRI